MKKIKILLSAVAVFAVVGGALAFKANQSQFLYVHDANDARISACTKQVFQATLTVNPSPITVTRASTAFTTAGCPVVTIYQGL